MKRKNQLISAITPLAPISVIDIVTGEYIPLAVLQTKISQIFNVVTAETEKLYAQHKDDLFESLVNYNGTPQPAEYARQQGICTSFSTVLPREVLAKSRLEKLVQHKLISETASYVANPNPDKQEPVFGKTINLGAVDKQMATLSLDGEELNLLWKCWDREYYITFQLPKYILNRKIAKFSLPLVKLSKNTGAFEFIFSLFEETKQRKGKKHTVGIDLGKVIPYSMVVVNNYGQRVASYESSPRLTKLSNKRERLIGETRSINSKIKNRADRGLSSPTHEIELERVRAKATRLTKTIAQQTGSEISRKLAKHNSSLIKIENLSWVSGFTNSKIGSSRWSHSLQQEAITHATARIGYKTTKINPKNTSQTCHKCKSKIVHRTKTRSVWCGACKTLLDRDFNAAMNIANQPLFPVSKKLNGDITGNSDVILLNKEAFSGTLDNTLSDLTRKTT